ncbi:hypothetical protein ACQ4PT_039921 [Festuca glaucescens]
MAKSKNDDKADAAEVAAIRLDVESMGTKVDDLQTEVTAVKSQLSRMEEMMLRMERVLNTAPDPETTNTAGAAKVQTVVHHSAHPETSAAGAQRATTQGESPLDRGTPVWRRMGRQEQSRQGRQEQSRQEEYHDYRDAPQTSNPQQAYYETAVYTHDANHYGHQTGEQYYMPQYNELQYQPTGNNWEAPTCFQGQYQMDQHQFYAHAHNMSQQTQYHNPPPAYQYQHHQTYQTQGPNAYEHHQYYPPGQQHLQGPGQQNWQGPAPQYLQGPGYHNQEGHRYARNDRNNFQDRDAQFYRAIAKPPKLDFPRFDGSNPMEWLRTTEKYFAMVYVPENAKFDYAQMYLTGRADVWLRNSGVLDQELTWKQFCDIIIQRFSGDNSYDVVDNFNNIKQGNSTVAEYTDRFEEKMSSYKKENPGVTEGYYVKCYINGLRGEIKHYLKPLKPTNLYEAVEYARDMEMGVQAQQQSRKFSSASTYQRSSNYTPNYTKPKPAEPEK